MKNSDTKFLAMIKHYGIKRLFLSPDFLVAVVVTSMLTILVSYYQLENDLIPNIFTIYATVAAAMIAIVIASLAIIVSTGDEEFTALLNKAGSYSNILFVFWYSSIIAGLGLAINVSAYIYGLVNLHHQTLSLIMICLTTFFTSYAVLAVVSAIGTTMTYGLFRAYYAEVRLYSKNKKLKH